MFFYKPEGILRSIWQCPPIIRPINPEKIYAYYGVNQQGDADDRQRCVRKDGDDFDPNANPSTDDYNLGEVQVSEHRSHITPLVELERLMPSAGCVNDVTPWARSGFWLA